MREQCKNLAIAYIITIRLLWPCASHALRAGSEEDTSGCKRLQQVIHFEVRARSIWRPRGFDQSLVYDDNLFF